MPSPLPGRAFTWKIRGLSDAVDGTNVFAGAMSSLQNLVPDPGTKSLFVPRPAAVALPAFTGFTSPAAITCLYTVGNLAYGMISTGRNPGLDEPFAYNMSTAVMQVISGVLATNVPTSPMATGDWVPPTMALVAGRVVVTHPGFPGGAGNYIGWLDISGFVSNTLTGSTHATTTLDTLSADVLTAGWQAGMTLSSSNGDIPAATTIVSIAANGLSLVMSKAATGSNAGGTITATGGTATAPQWGAGNTAVNPLASVPLCVAQFNGRAYYGVGAGVSISDAGFPTQITNASQGLLFRNGLNVTALVGLPLLSTTQGGVVQSLVAFQGASSMQQIVGDPQGGSGGSSTLSVNQITSSTGTLAPNTITPLPGGNVAFMAPDGIRVVNQTATVSDPLGSRGMGVSVPFRYAIFPSRACAAFNQNVLRVTVQNGKKANQPFEEYWLDLSVDEKIWTGPHTFPAALIAAWQGSDNNTFVMAPSPSLQLAGSSPSKWGGFNWGAANWGGAPIASQLWQSDPQPSTISVYTENGAPMTWNASSVLLPDNEANAANCVIEGTWAFELPAGVNVAVTVTDEIGNVLNQIQVMSLTAVQTTWGAFSWGLAPWAQQQANYVQYPLAFTRPVVFKQAIFTASATSAAGSGIGNLYLRVEELNYDFRGVAA